MISRRAACLLGAGAALTACAGTDSDDPAPPVSTGPATAAPTTSDSPTSPGATVPSLPVVRRWEPNPGDLDPGAKLAAVRRVESAGNTGRRVVEVIDAQYGGLLSTTASVLVVTRTWMRRNGRIEHAGHTFDVRVTLRAQRWRVTAIRPSRPGPAARRLSAPARRVLASDRIDLPPAGRADVASGQVHDSALAAMLLVATRHRIAISVVRSGHPIYVFGTDRLSDHPQGRAFDTWRIDGHSVVDPRTSRSLIEAYMHAVAATGSYNVGGPYLLGSAPQWFSDDTHHDHVHAGFTA